MIYWKSYINEKIIEEVDAQLAKSELGVRRKLAKEGLLKERDYSINIRRSEDDKPFNYRIEITFVNPETETYLILKNFK